jgi:hypothetical protein
LIRTTSVRGEAEKVSTNSCIHCTRGWTYHEDEETGEDVAIPCWMCDTLDALHADLERLGG